MTRSREEPLGRSARSDPGMGRSGTTGRRGGGRAALLAGALLLLVAVGRPAAADEAAPPGAGSTPAPAAASPAPPASPAPDPWSFLARLEGRWEGTTKGEPGEGTVERTYERVLRRRYLEVRGRSVYPAKEAGKEPEVHEEIGYYSWDRGRRKLVLRQFHVEGFVNVYAGDAPPPGAQRLVLDTESIENIPSGWRAREEIRLLEDGTLVETFSLGAPGKELAVYSESRLRRK